MIIIRYYPDGPVNIHIQSLINIIQENNWVITTKIVRVNYHYFVVTENGTFPYMVELKGRIVEVKLNQSN